MPHSGNASRRFLPYRSADKRANEKNTRNKPLSIWVYLPSSYSLKLSKINRQIRKESKSESLAYLPIPLLANNTKF